ncbi:helix-turn-helix transcriptional regulator [Clostridium sp.]|uniref:helix-turn-helix domain-containing protein n=1 Tax=Clostridium sp. TaxID=1506 RepID=UPI002FCB5E5F
MSLGQTIKNIRNSKGFSIMKVKELTGLSKSTISDLENDKSSPTADTLQKLATALEVPVEEFFKEGNDTEDISKEDNAVTPNTNAEPSPLHLTIKEQEQIGEEGQKILREFALSLSKEKNNLKEEDYMVLGASIMSALETIKIKNKVKYSSKKYKNNEEK